MCSLPRPWGEVTSLAIAPGGKRIVSGSNDGRLHIWDADTGAEVSKWVRVR